MTDIEKVARANCRGSWQLGTACGKCPRCESTRQTIDSGMDAATVQKAEWLWTQLPILTRWHAQPTYVKAIVCRAIRKIEADAQAAIAAMQPAPQEPVAWMYTHPDDPFPPSVRTDRHDKYDFAAMAKRGWIEHALGIIPTPPTGGSDAE